MSASGAIGVVREPQVYAVEQSVETPDGSGLLAMRLCLIWVKNIQYELIEPISDELGVYMPYLTQDRPLAFHHICMRVSDWPGFRAEVAQQDLSLVFEHDMGPNKIKFLYLDARATLRHFLEYTWMSDQGWDEGLAL